MSVYYNNYIIIYLWCIWCIFNMLLVPQQGLTRNLNTLITELPLIIPIKFWINYNKLPLHSANLCKYSRISWKGPLDNRPFPSYNDQIKNHRSFSLRKPFSFIRPVATKCSKISDQQPQITVKSNILLINLL